jgi:lipid-binding SYLF domain-containing protein
MMSLTRAKGIFAGVSLEGVSFGVDTEANEAYYRKGVTARDILLARSVKKTGSNKLARTLTSALK